MTTETACRTVTLPDPDATKRFGVGLGRRLCAGAVVALVGELGAGKTFLCRAIAEGLGVPDPGVVTSPTYVLIQEYEGGRLPVYHFDAYRLSDETAFAELGADEYLAGNGVCLIEWADRVPNYLPANHLRIHLVALGESSREARIRATGPWQSTAVEEISAVKPET